MAATTGTMASTTKHHDTASDEAEKEPKVIKTLFATSITSGHEEDECDRLLLKHSLWKFIRITCWISRFFNNCRQTKTKGPLTTEETKKQLLKYWIHREQQIQVTNSSQVNNNSV